MKSRFGASRFIFFSVFFAAFTTGAAASPKDMWYEASADSAARSAIVLAPDKFAHFMLDEAAMRSALANAPAVGPRSSALSLGAATVPVPLPSGEIIDMVVEETAIMEPELAAKFPSIKAFVGYAPGQTAIRGNLDFTEQGFHAMFDTEQGVVMIDPRGAGKDSRTYISYYKHDYHPLDKTPMQCKVHGDDESPMSLAAMSTPARTASRAAARSGNQLTTYRLAVAATGEYTQFQGGTVPLALSAIVTTINRVNTVYERDMAIHLQLVNNNNLIIYTNAATDPYTNNDASALLTQNQSNVDAVIGSANYDIGHVFGTGGGGLAALRVPCGASKAQGETGSSQPIGDGFDIDYVAHEMGHQFGGNHTFNATTSNCGGGNRNPSTAWEPGSGTTVMAYAGICGAEDLQPHSDSLFHAGSINEIISFITSGGGSTCGARTPISNVAPVANAGANYTIPANTPFVLTGSASDANLADTLTYAWDEMDLGAASTAADMGDQGTRPLFRSFVPNASPVRYFPKLQSILANTTDIGERLPTTNRSLNFRLTVRDQHGGVADDDVVLTVSAGAGPFRITAPNGGESLLASTTVTWNVANTNVAPVNCANVNISLSTDGGASFPTALLSGAPNNGSASVNFPSGSSSTARLKVQCANNIFFDISDNNFTFANNAPPPTYTLTVNASGASSVAIGAVPVTYAGTTSYSKLNIAAGTGITLTAPATASGAAFTSWSGCDTAVGLTCSVTMNGAKNVAAGYSHSGPPVNLIQNSGFESGAASWSQSSSGGYPLIGTWPDIVPHSGIGYAYLAGYDSATDYIEQSVAIPGNVLTANLEFWYSISTLETTPSIIFDQMKVELYTPAGAKLTTLTTLSNLNATAGWVKSAPIDVSAYKGQTVRVRFTATTDSADPTNFFVDDVSLTTTAPSVSRSVVPILMLLLN